VARGWRLTGRRIARESVDARPISGAAGGRAAAAAAPSAAAAAGAGACSPPGGAGGGGGEAQPAAVAASSAGSAVRCALSHLRKPGNLREKWLSEDLMTARRCQAQLAPVVTRYLGFGFVGGGGF